MSIRKIVIGGASGLIGSALTNALAQRGDDVVRLVRGVPQNPTDVEWRPDRGDLAPQVLADADAVILLNGASVGRLPWTRKYREVLRASRIDATRTVVRALQQLGSGAPALLSGSAVGYYGSVPGPVREGAPPGKTFLARLCVEWEAAAREAESVSRVALLRTAPILHPRGVLAPMMKLTALGLGGPLGSGTQHWPWISLEDEVAGILHILDQRIEGAVNLSGPTPATANDIGRSVARALHRPFWLRAPEWVLNWALGPAAKSLITVDADVRPGVLLESGYKFRFETAEAAVRGALRSPANRAESR